MEYNYRCFIKCINNFTISEIITYRALLSTNQLPSNQVAINILTRGTTIITN